MTTVELSTWTDTGIAVTDSSSWLTFSAEMLYARLQNMKARALRLKYVGSQPTAERACAVLGSVPQISHNVHGSAVGAL